MQTPDELINSALNTYRVDIVDGSTWVRIFVKAPNLITARFLAKAEKAAFIANRANKRVKTIVKRWKST